MQSEDLVNCWDRTNTSWSSSVWSWLNGLQLSGLHSLLCHLTWHLHPQSQLQQWAFWTQIGKEHFGLLTDSWIIISMMMVNLSFYWAGIRNMRLHGIHVSTCEMKLFPGSFLLCVGKCRTGLNTHQKVVTSIPSANEVRKYLPTMWKAAPSCFEHPHHL